jgi:23S rRNA (adenine-N6)-dimethyltransferase
MRKRILLSQNYIRDKKTVLKIINKSSINQNDLVVEIGAGNGIITQELIRKCKKVIVYELDNNLYNKLALRLSNNSNIIILNEDFLQAKLPNPPYKIFSNIPFNITSEVIKKITQTNNPPEDTYAVVQKEAAEKLICDSQRGKNSMLSVILYPRYNISIIHTFNRYDFYPKPRVDSCMVRIYKREFPLIESNKWNVFNDFVAYCFNTMNPSVYITISQLVGNKSAKNIFHLFKISNTSKPSGINGILWIQLFNALEKFNSHRLAKIEGYYEKLKKQQDKIFKINRTRLDKKWRKY